MIYYIAPGFTNIQKKYIHRVMDWTMEKMPSIYESAAEVEIRGTVKDDLVGGYCDHEFGNEYTIGLNRDTGSFDLCLTLVHEMKHLEQFLNGKLVTKDQNGAVKWEGKVWLKLHMDVLDYDLLPWEQEAVQAEALFAKDAKKIVDIRAIKAYIHRIRNDAYAQLKQMDREYVLHDLHNGLPVPGRRR